MIVLLVACFAGAAAGFLLALPYGILPVILASSLCASLATFGMGAWQAHRRSRACETELRSVRLNG
jgi:hypothetical protein